MPIRFKDLLIITLLFSGCTACSPPIQVGQFIDQKPVDQQLTNYEVQIKDIPTDWKFKGQSWGDDFGGQSHFVGYGIDGDDGTIRLTHTLSIYSDDAQAKNAYPKWEAEWFAGLWQTWPGADFVPSDPSDVYKFECLQMSPNHPLISCRYLQMHKRLISFVLVNLDDKAMTFAQLNGILKTVDERLNTIELK